MTEGLLQEIPLAEMLQLITTISGETGVLELMPLFPANQPRTQIPVGQIFFREGHVHAAFLADRSREAAVENLFLWEAGFFTFQRRDKQDLPPANIFIDSSLLMLQGITRLDEWTRTRHTVPTLHIILRESNTPSGAPPPAAHTPAAQVLAQCDGLLSLTDIAKRLGIGRLRCREAAAELLRQGFLVASPPSAGQRLIALISYTAHPMLGVAAELFCEDALRTLHIPPETLPRITDLTVATVASIVKQMEQNVAEVLGPQRARDLAAQLCTALGIPGFEQPEKEKQHAR